MLNEFQTHYGIIIFKIGILKEHFDLILENSGDVDEELLHQDMKSIKFIWDGEIVR